MLLYSFLCSGTTYYVKTGGNDSNTGLSDEQAWAHHPWMNSWTGSVVLKAGDIVYLKRNHIWSVAHATAPFIFTSQEGTENNFIVTSAYGSGNDPIIEISADSPYPVIRVHGGSYLIFDHLHIKHFSSSYLNKSGYSGILITKDGSRISHHINITNCEIHDTPYAGILGSEDSYNIIVGDTTVRCTASSTKFSNNIHDFGYAGVLLEGVNPFTGESQFYVNYNYIHDATRINDGDNEYGIYFGAIPTSTAWPKYAYAQYNRVINIKSWEGMDCHGGSYIYFTDNYISNFGTCGIIAADYIVGSLKPTLDHIYIERNTIEQPLDGWITGRESSFILHFNSTKEVVSSDIFIKDNECYYSSRPTAGKFSGIRAGNVDRLSITGNKIRNGSLLSGSPGISLTDNYGTYGNKNVTISGNFVYEWGPGININGISITGPLIVSNNIINRPATNACLVFSEGDISSNGTVYLYNNVFFADDYSGSIYASNGIADGGTVIAKNNIIGWLKPFRGYYWQWRGNIAGTLECDYNLYWNCESDISFYQSGINYNKEEWKTHGQDSHSIINADPDFINLNSYTEDLDFYIKSTSPAINAGTIVGITNDFSGAAITGIPDIGAFERQEGSEYPYPIYQDSQVTDSSSSDLIINYNVDLADISPSVSDFTVLVNSIYRKIDKININGKIVLLTMSSPVAYGDIITITYIRPSTNPLQNFAGGQARSFRLLQVTNNLSYVNVAPIIIVKFNTTGFSGFIYELDASESYDLNNDILTYEWSSLNGLPLSSKHDSRIKYLSPILDKPGTIEFIVKVSDGVNTQSKRIAVEIFPYKAELKIAEIKKIAGSDSIYPHVPHHMIDGNDDTFWASYGVGQFTTISLKETFNIYYIMSKFPQIDKSELTFDIYGSRDNTNWEPILLEIKSCEFSNEYQIFDLPESKIFTYIKYIGKGNSLDEWNYISELKFLGFPAGQPTFLLNETEKVKLAISKNIIYVSCPQLTELPLSLKILNIGGGVVVGETFPSTNMEYTIPKNVPPGFYILQISNGKNFCFNKKIAID